MQNNDSIILIVRNTVKQYQWGSTNPLCFVNKLSSKLCKNWAELWMGMHPNGQSILENSQSISEYLYPQKETLDFLFKVLSIQKCLSIQVHPNKQQAIELNQKKPQLYMDNNDKPEMFLTLTKFQCFLGFVSDEQIKRISQISPFNNIFGSDKVSVKQLLKKLLHLSPEEVQNHIKILNENIEVIHPNRKQLLEKINKQFPGDVGILVSCLLQYHQIDAHKCFYIPPKTPHAYVFGEIFEIMKNSDNVVRLGLTPKLKDQQTLLAIVNTDNWIPKQIFPSQNNNNKCIQKFIANHLVIYLIEDQCELNLKGYAIGIVLEGEFNIGQHSSLKLGNSFLMKPQTHLIKGKGKLYVGSYEN